MFGEINVLLPDLVCTEHVVVVCDIDHDFVIGVLCFDLRLECAHCFA